MKQIDISVIERVDTTKISDENQRCKPIRRVANLVSLTLALIKVRSLLEFSTKPTLLTTQSARRDSALAVNPTKICEHSCFKGKQSDLERDCIVSCEDIPHNSFEVSCK